MDERLQYVETFQYPHNGQSVIRFEDGSATTIYVEDEIKIGFGTAMDPNIKIGMYNKPLKKFIVGDHVRLFAGQIASQNFVCGDYVTIHEGIWCYGHSDVVIGHNAWFGMRCTLDAEGGAWIGNGFCAAQETHLWSHIRHGDIVQGCRLLGFEPFTAEDDVWFCPRSNSAPAHHEQWSVALTAANITKGMKRNHIYGGNPAIDLTEKMGVPYEPIGLQEKEKRFQEKVHLFETLGDVRDVEFDAITNTFDVTTRTYKKTNSPLEVAFMHFLLPEAKFVPEDHLVVSL